MILKSVLFPSGFSSFSVLKAVFASNFGRKMSSDSPNRMQFIDIGANLTDSMYSGVYNGTTKHEGDLDKVLERSWAVGLEKIIVTSGNLEESKRAAKLCSTNERLYSTVGVHPTRCTEFDQELPSPMEYIQALKTVFDENKDKIVALGEFGLDYDRTQFCDIETQKKYFALQLKELVPYTKLPLFLHCRGALAVADLIKILTENAFPATQGGVVHSFDGKVEDFKALIDLGFCIGVNGCSLKNEETCEVIRQIPVEKLLLETDSPWCGIRPSHFSAKFIKTKFEAAKKTWTADSMYKTRNEPQTILNVLEVVAGLKGIEDSVLAEQVYQNTVKLFFPQ